MHELSVMCLSLCIYAEQNVILLEVKDKVLESLVAQNQVVEDEV